MQTFHNILFTAEKYQSIQKNIPPTAKIESSIPNPLGLPSFFLPCPGILGLARHLMAFNMLQGKQDILILDESRFLFFLWFQTNFFFCLYNKPFLPKPCMNLLKLQLPITKRRYIKRFGKSPLCKFGISKPRFVISIEQGKAS